MRAIAGGGDRVAVFNVTSHSRHGSPSCGWAVFDSWHDRGVAATDGSIENEFLRVEWDERGYLTSIWDKEVGREVLSGLGNVLELHDDNPRRRESCDLAIEHPDSFATVS